MSEPDPAHDSFMSFIRARIPTLITRVLEPLPSHARSADLDASLRSLIELVAGMGFTNGMDCVDVDRIKKEAYRDGKRDGLKAGMNLGLAKAAQEKPECVSVAVQASTNPPRCVSASTQTSLLNSPSRCTTSTSTQTSPTLDDSILPLSHDLPSTISDAIELPAPSASDRSSSEKQKTYPAPSPTFVRDFSSYVPGTVGLLRVSSIVTSALHARALTVLAIILPQKHVSQIDLRHWYLIFLHRHRKRLEPTSATSDLFLQFELNLPPLPCMLPRSHGKPIPDFAISVGR
ncbi:hypothetical protein R3P38DRAFT_3104582 [Favolaschia claudopus]|uniref:Uncharacterized protein n=1 Tax=Favolaschia claudopus TaxID=2862362 RepID=A0AAV9ZK16_9AGAR